MCSITQGQQLQPELTYKDTSFVKAVRPVLHAAHALFNLGWSQGKAHIGRRTVEYGGFVSDTRAEKEDLMSAFNSDMTFISMNPPGQWTKVTLFWCIVQKKNLGRLDRNTQKNVHCVQFILSVKYFHWQKKATEGLFTPNLTADMKTGLKKCSKACAGNDKKYFSTFALPAVVP